MRQGNNSNYILPVFISIALHAMLAFIFFWHWQGGGQSVIQEDSTPIVQATTIDSEAVDKEIARLKRIEQEKVKKQQALIRQQKAMKLAAQKAQKQRKLEQARANRIRREAARAKKEALKRQAEAAEKAKQNLAEVKALVKEREKKLSSLEAENQAIETQKRLAAEKLREEKKALEKVKQARLQEALRRKALAEKRAELEAQLKQQAEKQARLERARQQEIQRQQAEKREKIVAAEVDKFSGLVRQKVTRNWLIQGVNHDGAACIVKVLLGAGGIVLDVELLQTSGDAALDRSAIAAVYKSSPLPVPENSEAFERMRVLRMTLKPEDILTTG